jgi:hypothetical protein
MTLVPVDRLEGNALASNQILFHRSTYLLGSICGDKKKRQEVSAQALDSSQTAHAKNLKTKLNKTEQKNKYQSNFPFFLLLYPTISTIISVFYRLAS